MRRRRVVVRLVPASPAEILAGAKQIFMHASDFGGTNRGEIVRWALKILSRAKRVKVAA